MSRDSWTDLELPRGIEVHQPRHIWIFKHFMVSLWCNNENWSRRYGSITSKEIERLFSSKECIFNGRMNRHGTLKLENSRADYGNRQRVNWSVAQIRCIQAAEGFGGALRPQSACMHTIQTRRFVLRGKRRMSRFTKKLLTFEHFEHSEIGKNQWNTGCHEKASQLRKMLWIDWIWNVTIVLAYDDNRKIFFFFNDKNTTKYIICLEEVVPLRPPPSNSNDFFNCMNSSKTLDEYTTYIMHLMCTPGWFAGNVSASKSGCFASGLSFNTGFGRVNRLSGPRNHRPALSDDAFCS